MLLGCLLISSLLRSGGLRCHAPKRLWRILVDPRSEKQPVKDLLSQCLSSPRARLFERGLSLNLGLNRLVALFEGRLTLTSGQTAG